MKPIEKACFKLEKTLQDCLRKKRRVVLKRLKLKLFRIDRLIDLEDHRRKLACTCLADALLHLKALRAFRSLNAAGFPDHDQPSPNQPGRRIAALLRSDRLLRSVLGHQGNPHVNKLFCFALKLDFVYRQAVRDRKLALLTKAKRVMEMKKFGKNAVKDLVARLELFKLSRIIKGYRSIKEFDRLIKGERMIKALDIYAYFFSHKVFRPALEKWHYWIKNSRKKGVAFREILTFMNKKIGKVAKAAFKSLLDASLEADRKPPRQKSLLEPRPAEVLPKRTVTPKSRDAPQLQTHKPDNSPGLQPQKDKPHKIHKSKETPHLVEPKKLYGTFSKPKEPEPRPAAEKTEKTDSSKSAKSPKPTTSKKSQQQSPRTHTAADKEEARKVQQRATKTVLSSPREPGADRKESKIRVEFKQSPRQPVEAEQPESRPPAQEPPAEADRSVHVRTASVAASSLGESASEARQMLIKLRLTPELVQRINRQYSEMQASKDASLCDEIEVLASVDFEARPQTDLLAEEIQIENVDASQANRPVLDQDEQAGLGRPGKGSLAEQVEHRLHEARHQRNKPTVSEADVSVQATQAAQVPPLNLAPALAASSQPGGQPCAPKVSLFTVEDDEKEEALTSERDCERLEEDSKAVTVEFIPKRSRDSPSKSLKSAEEAALSGEQAKKSFLKGSHVRPQDKFGFCKTSYVLSHLEEGATAKTRKRPSVGGSNRVDRGLNTSQEASQKTAKSQLKTND